MERAVDWLFSHMDDATDDETVNGAHGSSRLSFVPRSWAGKTVKQTTINHG